MGSPPPLKEDDNSGFLGPGYRAALISVSAVFLIATLISGFVLCRRQHQNRPGSTPESPRGKHELVHMSSPSSPPNTLLGMGTPSPASGVSSDEAPIRALSYPDDGKMSHSSTT